MDAKGIGSFGPPLWRKIEDSPPNKSPACLLPDTMYCTPHRRRNHRFLILFSGIFRVQLAFQMR